MECNSLPIITLGMQLYNIQQYEMVFLLYRIILYIKDEHNVVLTVLIAGEIPYNLAIRITTLVSEKVRTKGNRTSGPPTSGPPTSGPPTSGPPTSGPPVLHSI